MANNTYIVAELSANHGHKLENALASVRAAKEAGADAIKIQTYTADTMTLDRENEDFMVHTGTIWMVFLCTNYTSKPIPHGSGTRLSLTKRSA